jgi:hypothetical protein
MSDTTTAAIDWTADASGRSNSSPKYLALVDAVDQTIRGCAHALIGGKSRTVAAMIMAQLAHTHGLAPDRNPEPVNVELSDQARNLLRGLTVAQLRAALRDFPDDLPVVVYGEHGQNGESPASGVTVGWYQPESTWGGEFHDGTDPDRVPDPEAEARVVFIEPIN